MKLRWSCQNECLKNKIMNKNAKFQLMYINVHNIQYFIIYDCIWITTNCEKFLEMGIPDHLTCLLRILYARQSVTVRTVYGTMDWFKIRKGVCQGCILSPCLFNYMQSISCEMLGWMNHKLEARLREEISITSDMQMTPHLWQKIKRI